MAEVKRLVLLSLAAFLMVTMVARNVDAQCSINQLAGCANAVTSGAPPSVTCCAEVGAADPACFCKLLSGNSYPDAYVTNAILVPSKCGGAAEAKFKGRNCAGM